MARSFNGSSDRITPIANTNSSLTQYTVSFLIQPTVTPVNLASQFTWQNGTGNSILIRNNGSSIVQGWWNGSVYHSVTSNFTQTVGSWAYVICTWNGSAYAIYVNSSAPDNSVNDATGPSGLVPGGGTGVSIGCDAAGPGKFWTGNMAEVAVWNTALNTANITSLVNGVRPFRVNSANLVDWWPLDGLASPEPDLSGKGNNGTLTGTALAPGPPIMLFTPRWPQNSLHGPPGAAFNPAWAMGSRLVDGGIGI